LLKLLHNISGTLGLSETLSPELEIAALKQNVSIIGNLIAIDLTLSQCYEIFVSSPTSC
jgi:hypothetical protein